MYFLCFFLLAVLSHPFLYAHTHGRELVDRVVARVNNVPICLSDLQKKQIAKNLERYTLQEAIHEELWLQRAQSCGIMLTDQDFKKQAHYQRKSLGYDSVPDSELDAVFTRELGMSYAEYEQQLHRSLLVSRARSELYTRALVTDGEVRAYCKEHPVLIPARYRFRFARCATSEECRLRDGVHWVEVGPVAVSDIAKHLQGVCALQQGEYSLPIEHNGSFFVVHLLEYFPEQEKAVEDRYSTIEYMLQQEKLERIAQQVEDELIRAAVIVKIPSL